MLVVLITKQAIFASLSKKICKQSMNNMKHKITNTVLSHLIIQYLERREKEKDSEHRDGGEP